MKTPEEWLTDKEHGFGFSFVDDINPAGRTMFSDSRFILIIKQIQLDAWKQGMIDAAEIANNQYSESSSPYYIKACADCCNAIVDKLENKAK